MKKKILIALGSAAVLGVACWLISPLWRDVALDEELPQVHDALGAMDENTKSDFRRQVTELGGLQTDRAEMMPMGSSVVAQGVMVAAAHEVSGRALVVDTGPMRYLRFEDLETVNGPDLRIRLSAGLSDDDVIDLGAVRATRGSVNYAIPPGTDLSRYRYAMVWCRAFSVLFSFAELR